MRNKKLIVVGNSVALIIDKPLQRKLGIGPKSLVRVTTDGNRIVIEPDGRREEEDAYLEGPHARRATLGLRAVRVVESLVNDLGMTQKHFEQMETCLRRNKDWRLYKELVRTPCSSSPSFELTMIRLEICLQALEKGCTWETAIQHAIDTATATHEAG